MRPDTTSVSVVIPCYNAEAYLAEAIESVLGQSRPPAEVLVVDDGSRDASRAVAERFAPAVKVICQLNAGPAAARNHGLQRARGEFVAFLDADDLWLPEKLDLQLAKAAEGHDLVYCDAENFGQCRDLPRFRSEYTELPEGRVFVPLLLGNFVATSGVLLRRSAVAGLAPADPGGGKRNGLFQARFSPAEDWAAWLELAVHASFGCVRRPLVRYRVHAGGISRNARAMLIGSRRALEFIRTLPASRAVPPGIWRQAKANLLGVSGLRCELGGQANDARLLYASALGLEPWRLKRWKALARACLVG